MRPINIMGSLNVLQLRAKVEARKVVYAASGGTIYGEPQPHPGEGVRGAGLVSDEPYGISKKVVMDYLGFFQRYRGLDFTAFALGNVYGPRQDPHGEAGVIAIFSSKMLAGETPRSSATGTRPATTCSSTTWCTPSSRRWTEARASS